jgi:hypothetical protein
VPTATALSGDVTVSDAGVTAIGSGVIVDADIDASAAIVGTKISPDFGSQNVVTTGTATAASLSPTGSTVPANGVYLPEANEVGISTDGSNRLHIDSTGNVGIGTTSPGSALEIDAAAATSPFIAKINTAEAARIDSDGRLLVGTSSDTSGGNGNALLQVVSSGPGRVLPGRSDGNTAADQAIGAVDFRSFAGSAWESIATITAFSDGVSGSGDKPGRLVFSTTADGASTPTERMRIDNAGAISMGTAATISVASGTDDGLTFSPPGVLSLSRDSFPSLQLRRRSANGNIATFYRDTTNVGAISVTTTATAYNTSSDYRLKENVVPLSGAIDRLQQIPVHRFNFIADPDIVVDGFLAHEAQEIVPECVTGTKDEVDEDGNPVYQGIDQSKLVPLLTAALKEAITEIASLKDSVAALEAS